MHDGKREKRKNRERRGTADEDGDYCACKKIKRNANEAYVSTVSAIAASSLVYYKLFVMVSDAVTLTLLLRRIGHSAIDIGKSV